MLLCNSRVIHAEHGNQSADSISAVTCIESCHGIRRQSRVVQPREARMSVVLPQPRSVSALPWTNVHTTHMRACCSNDSGFRDEYGAVTYVCGEIQTGIPAIDVRV